MAVRRIDLFSLQNKDVAILDKLNSVANQCMKYTHLVIWNYDLKQVPLTSNLQCNTLT